ncbi:hypothetical protein AB0D71_44095 [Streptomyces avermitilis]|uniref:hypothetical protein n=1 Tax=Streptomyces avermitilis TaxID=33903 RepID=UPI0033C0C2A4
MWFGEVPDGSGEDFGDGGLGGFLVDEGLACGERGDEGLKAEVVDDAGEAARGRVDEGDSVVGNSWSLRPARPRWCLM